MKMFFFDLKPILTTWPPQFLFNQKIKRVSYFWDTLYYELFQHIFHIRKAFLYFIKQWLSNNTVLSFLLIDSYIVCYETDIIDQLYERYRFGLGFFFIVLVSHPAFIEKNRTTQRLSLMISLVLKCGLVLQNLLDSVYLRLR